jgi:prepilin-type N-terminal cleavage/methylation domain-containing protein
MVHPRRTPFGYTLIEILLVVSIVAVLAASMLTSSNTGARGQLRSLAHIIQTDLAYARSLAVANGTPYRLAFSAVNSQYTLEHVGDNDAWDTLPPSPFHPQTDTNTSQTVRVDDLPSTSGNVKILGAFTVADDNTLTRVDFVTFSTIGQTLDRAEETVIWLAAGTESEMRYQSIRINPVTGLANIDDVTGDAPQIDELDSGAADDLVSPVAESVL